MDLVECPYKKVKFDNNLELHSSPHKQQTIQNDNQGNTIEDLRQFQVLDEVQCDNSASESGDCYDGDDSTGSELDEEEIENMLDEGLPDELKNKRKESQYEEKYKTVLEEKGRNHFDVLPEGWVQVTHNSGIPLYLHKTSRVCSIARPYFLGPGSARKHEVPLSAIPCLSYRKALEKEHQAIEDLKKKQEEELNCKNETVNENDANLNKNSNYNNKLVLATKNSFNNSKTKPILPNAKIETVTENLQTQSLKADQVTEYCKKLFHFKSIRVMRFRSWSARRKFTKNKKHIKNLQRPTLPDGTKLITFPVLNSDGDNNNSSRPKKEWIMNPNGKSYVCILHEYVQHALKKQPSYEFKELENAATPYSATVTINNLKYGTGYGTSKKQAKSEAARETLEILIPEMRDKISGNNSNNNSQNSNINNNNTNSNSSNNINGTNNKESYQDLSVFDEIKIEDPRVAEFCAKTTEPSPHAILLTCLQRNYGLGDIHIKYEVNTLKHKKNEFTMVVGKHSATVICKNKRDGKQRASQAILQILHPHIKTWGSLLRLYGNRSVKSFKEKKQEEQEITVLQSKAAINQPNYAILDKLKLEMNKLRDRRVAIIAIGTFIPPNDVDLPKATGSNLKNVDL